MQPSLFNSPRNRTAGWALLWTTAVIAIALSTSSCLDLCGNTVAEEVASPDGRWKAWVFERSCGAATGFSTQVSVLPGRSSLPNEGGNVFAADSNQGAVPLRADFTLALELRWLGDQQLEIAFPAGARVSTAKEGYRDVSVLYREIE